MLRIFTQHPRTVGESYFAHMRSAFAFAAELLICGFACLVHGLLPFLFVETGSRGVTRLHDKMVCNRARHRRQTSHMLPE